LTGYLDATLIAPVMDAGNPIVKNELDELLVDCSQKSHFNCKV
jgi:hypothetical protein